MRTRSQSPSPNFATTLLSLAMTCSGLAFVACGGGTPPADSPAGSSSAAPSGSASPSDKTEAPAAASDSNAQPSEDKSAKGAPAAAGGDASEGAASEGPLRQALTKPGVIFMFSFNDSDTKKAAEQACSKEASDAKKNAECMSKAQKKIDVNGQRFKEEGGTWYWMTVQRRGNSLTTLHKVEFDFGAETAKGITIKPKGKDKGSKPWARVPSEVTIEMTSGDEIALPDPQNGRMVYQAKVGLASD